MRGPLTVKRPTSILRAGLVALAGATPSFVPARAAADQAIVVGVQQYTNLPRANTLRGCLNDARAMEEVLGKRGFKVTLLTNERATKDGILAAIRALSSTLKPDEKFVFYFAGHGRDIPAPALMPSDATDTANCIAPDELYDAVRALPAAARTVILDSCFSGAMSKAIHPEFVARYYAPEGTRSITPRPPSGADTQQNLQKRPEVCYWTASQSNQQSIEGRFKGEAHGVFTNAAQQVLSTVDPKQTTWEQANTEVKGKMAEVLGDKFHQSPTITPALVDAPLFETKIETPTHQADAAPAADVPLAGNLWDQFNTDRVNPGMVALSVSPDQTAFEVGTDMVFRVKVGADGYLVVLERDVDNKVYLTYPETASAEAAAVQAGQAIRIPADLTKVLQPQDKGIEHLKAILLGSRDQAESIIGSLPKSGAGIQFASTKKLRIAPAKKAPVFTSEITISVVGKGDTRQ